MSVPAREAAGPDQPTLVRVRFETLDWLGLSAALVTVVLWASAFVGIRAAAVDLSPGALAFGRLFIGTVALGLLVAIRRLPLPRGRDLGRIVAAGILWFGAYNVSLNAAERLVDAGTAALLLSVGPLLIVVFAGVFIGEGFPPRLLIGSIVAFAGAIVIGLATTGQGVGDEGLVGIALCLLAAVAYAIGVTLEKPVVGRVSAVTVTWLACAVGALVTLPFAPQLVSELTVADGSSIAWMVYLGAVATSVAFTTWAFALSRTTAGQLGSTTNLVAPLAIVIGWILLGEAPPPLAIGGGLLAIAGVAVAHSRRGDSPERPIPTISAKLPPD